MNLWTSQIRVVRKLHGFFCVEKSHHLRKKMMARCQVLDFAATYTTCGYPARISTRAETHQQAAARWSLYRMNSWTITTSRRGITQKGVATKPVYQKAVENLVKQPPPTRRLFVISAGQTSAAKKIASVLGHFQPLSALLAIVCGFCQRSVQRRSLAHFLVPQAASAYARPSTGVAAIDRATCVAPWFARP